MRVGVRGHDVPAANAAELACKLLQLGVDCIQLVPHKSFPNFSYSREEICQLHWELNRAGIRVAVYGCYIDPLEAQGRSRFLEHIEYAAMLGADWIATESGIAASSKPAEGACFRAFADTFRKFADRAEEYGIGVALEPVGIHPIHSPIQTRRLLDQVDRENLYVVMDPENLQMGQNESNAVAQTVRLLEDRITVLHWKEERPDPANPILRWAARRPVTVITEGLQGESLRRTLHTLKGVENGICFGYGSL